MEIEIQEVGGCTNGLHGLGVMELGLKGGKKGGISGGNGDGNGE